MNFKTEDLDKLIDDIANSIQQEQEPSSQQFQYFANHPEAALDVISILEQWPEMSEEEDADTHEDARYSACIFIIDVAIAQLHSAQEAGNKASAKQLLQLMNHMASAMRQSRHGISFWLPILNAFYETRTEMSQSLKDAYFDLASTEEPPEFDENMSSVDSIRDLLNELKDLSEFDKAAHLFSQGYAMPPEFFSDLVFDLYELDEGHDVALLALLHPQKDVRDIVFATINQIIHEIDLSPRSLNRLNSIMYWYPESYRETIQSWIKIQRKKGMVFDFRQTTDWSLKARASEIDGSGSQGIFVHMSNKRQHRLCGILLRHDQGIRDAWITPFIAAKDIKRYYNDAVDASVTLRDIDNTYIKTILEHFLAINIQNGQTPDLYLLEIQELFGWQLKPNPIETNELIEQLCIQIQPFTQEVIDDSIKRSQTWHKTKKFMSSWFVENTVVDHQVKFAMEIVDGVKICDMAKAKAALFQFEFEPHRDYWAFHFLWMTLWSHSCPKKNEKLWQDCLILAHLIKEGIPLSDISVMDDICRQSVINSVETMQDRKTHLST